MPGVLPEGRGSRDAHVSFRAVVRRPAGRGGGRCFCSPGSGSWSSASVDARVLGQSGRSTAALLPFLPGRETLVTCSVSCSERSWFSTLRSFRAVRPLLVAAPCPYASGRRPGLPHGCVCPDSRSQRLPAVQSATFLLSLSRRRRPGWRTRQTWLLTSSHRVLEGAACSFDALASSSVIRSDAPSSTSRTLISLLGSPTYDFNTTSITVYHEHLHVPERNFGNVDEHRERKKNECRYLGRNSCL